MAQIEPHFDIHPRTPLLADICSDIEKCQEDLIKHKQRYKDAMQKLVKDIEQAYLTGMTTTKIAKLYGIPQRTIHDWLLKSGVKMRSVGVKSKNPSDKKS